ncbi:MAG: response regulator transcription factor [Ignavibacteriales bacterium]|nr:response regulator transcription factor [Ignavibacteriales bacterium]
MKKITVVLADDHAIMRDGLKMVLQTDKSVVIVGEASNGKEAVDLVRSLNPDILIVDINMPQISGIEAAQLIRKFNNTVKILALTMHDQENVILDAVQAGVNGYLLKMSDMDEFLAAIKSLAKGIDYFPAAIAQSVMKGLQHRGAMQQEDLSINLTPREKEILTLIAKGNTSQEIAGKLFISYFTVSKHRKNILDKLGLKNTAEVLMYAMNEKLI